MAKAEDETEEGAPAAAPKRDRRLLIAAAAAVVILLVAGGGAAWFMLSGTKSESEAKSGEAEKPASAESGEDRVFVDVPPLVVNLRTTDGSPHFLKLHFVLVAAKGVAEPELKEQIPVIIDSFQPFLRELRPDDLAGSAAVFRIKEELRLRAATALGPDKIEDILIQDLIQE